MTMIAAIDPPYARGSGRCRAVSGVRIGAPGMVSITSIASITTCGRAGWIRGAGHPAHNKARAEIAEVQWTIDPCPPSTIRRASTQHRPRTKGDFR